MSDWTDLLTNPTVHRIYYLLIEGIPQVLCSHPLPASWAAWGVGGRTQIHALDLSEGFTPPSAAINRKSGVATPGAVELRIGPDTGYGALRRLFSTALATGHRTRLSATLDWSDTTVSVVSTTGFVSPLYVGRETITFSGSTANSFTGCSRGAFGSLPWRRIGDDKDGLCYVTDYPSQWEGRSVRVIEAFSTSKGQPFDSAIYDPANPALTPYSHEVWRGLIDALIPEQNNVHWSMQLRGIEAVLDCEIGAYQVNGRLSAAAAQWAKHYDKSNQADSMLITRVSGVIAEGRNKIRFQGGHSPAYDTLNLEVTVPTGYSSDIAATIQGALYTALNAAPAPWSYCTWDVWVHRPQIEDFDDKNDYANLFQIWLVPEVTDPLWDASGAGDQFNPTVLVDDSSVLPLLGFPYGTYNGALVEASYDWNGTSNPTGNTATRLVALRQPPLLWIASTQTDIPLVVDVDKSTALGKEPPASGFAVIREPTTDRSEVVSYTTATKRANGLYLLEGCTRGVCGTYPVEWRIDWPVEALSQFTGTTADQGKQIRDLCPEVVTCIGWNDTSIVTILLQLLLSTGTAGTRHCTYDAGLGNFVSPGLDPSLIDIDQWLGQAERLPSDLRQRSMIVGQPLKIKDYLAAEMAALGWCIHARPATAGYQLCLEAVCEAPDVCRWVADSSNMSPDDWPAVQSNLSDIINKVEMKLGWNVGSEKATEDTWLWQSIDSQVNYGQVQSVTLSPKGLISPSTGTAAAIAVPLLARYAARYEIVTIGVGKDAWQWCPGDSVAVTLPGLPNRDGSAGWVEEPCTVVGVSPRLVGRGRKSLTVVSLLHVPVSGVTYYAPSVEVASYTPGSTTITLDPNSFQGTGRVQPETGEHDPDDYDFLVSTEKVIVENDGDSVGAVTRTLTATGTPGIYTLSSSLPGTMGVGSIVTFCGLSDATTRQKRWAYVAGSDGLLGTGNPKRWSS